MPLAADRIETLFTRADGTYLCARWGRPLAPVVFGVEDETIEVVRAALDAVCTLAGLELAEMDPELGANLMIFFVGAWDDLRGVPNLDRLIAGFDGLLDRLEAADAHQYRVFRFDEAGAIRACFAFVRIGPDLAGQGADVIALGQAVQAMLSWGEGAFDAASPLALAEGRTVLRPEIAALIAAAYDPVMPAMADDPAHALRLAARMRAT
ncbi:MAG: hypothetical protein HLUCCA08_16090 [Rhodobacteraceae bacterium HLUCCA08]|nr:MAG: hypothetical protein HLUCCA08_16090 [Rhodobacteraceae bacterium HLUCCA08]